MKIHLADQKNQLAAHLEALKRKPVMGYDKARLKEKTTTIKLDIGDPFEEEGLRVLFAYRIFPEHIMTFLTQWDQEKRTMKVGDTIVQQVYLPPFPRFSQKIVFGVRISEVIDEPDRKGFSYETLEGHVERGISTFTIERLEDRVNFKIQTYSTPGNMLTRLVGPVFSVPYQAYCTKAALEHVKRQVEAE
jgi:hypothetical protein